MRLKRPPKPERPKPPTLTELVAQGEMEEELGSRLITELGCNDLEAANIVTLSRLNPYLAVTMIQDLERAKKVVRNTHKPLK